MGYKIEYSKTAAKDARLLERSGLDAKAKSILSVMSDDPYAPPCEKLSRDLRGYFSRRINDKHRLVYEVLPNIDNLQDANGETYAGIVHVLRMWTHYD